MKTSVFYAMAAAKLAASHATFQSFVIDGKDQGQNFAVQKPSNQNNPILDVTSPLMNCKGGVAKDEQVEVAAGSKITMQWHHNDPVTTSGDTDEPIAASHKGPIMVYISDAKAAGTGAVWQKIYEEGLTGGKWAVDNFITNKGAITITLPNLKAGDYLIRPEIIALHEATDLGKAQFYNGCGHIKVTGSGSLALPATGTDMTKAYKAADPGVKYNLYSGATSYTIPGPALWTGAESAAEAPAAEAPAAEAPSSSAAATSAAAEPTAPAPSATATQPATPPATEPEETEPAAPQPSASKPAAPQPSASKPAAPQPSASQPAAPQPSASKPTTLVTSTKPAPTGTSGGAGVALYGRCGGEGYTGSSTCAQGTCKVQNPYYSQCIPA